MKVKPRRKLVQEVLDENPQLVSRRMMGAVVSEVLLEKHGFTYPNRVMRQRDLDAYVKSLDIPNRQGVSVTLLNKSLEVIDKAVAEARYGDAARHMEFVRGLLGADLSTIEAEGESAYDDMATGIQGLFDEINKRDKLTNEADTQEPDDGEARQGIQEDDQPGPDAGRSRGGIEGSEEDHPQA